MNERLLNYPVPPTVANPEITPQLQEVIYRALERDPRTATPRRASLHGSGASGSGGRGGPGGLRDWQKRKSQSLRKFLYYGGLAMIPVVLLLLMFLLAHRREGTGSWLGFVVSQEPRFMVEQKWPTCPIRRLRILAPFPKISPIQISTKVIPKNAVTRYHHLEPRLPARADSTTSQKTIP